MGKTLKLPKSIDTNKYDGQIVCQECKALLQVKLAKGKLQKYVIVERFQPSGPVKIVEIGQAKEGHPFCEIVKKNDQDSRS